MKYLVVIALLLAACGGAQHRVPRPTTGAIAGLARDHDSGDPVAKVQIEVRATTSQQPVVTLSRDNGLYDVDHLPPGRYSLRAQFAGQPFDVVNIDVRAGEVSIVDLVFTLGRPDPVKVDYSEPKSAAIDRYKPKNLAAHLARIEGTVNDAATRTIIAGAVITAETTGDTQQTISDDHGRYRFETVIPGTYIVSAYYAVGGRGQIEVRRSGIDVGGAEAVIVPLWIETNR